MPDDVVTEAERVRELRELLDERLQRAEAAQVPNDLARRLASLRDPAVVLSEVARQARRLLAVDVAYIMLLRPGRRAADRGGRRIDGLGPARDRAGPDTGLGGRCSGPAGPLWSERYLDDTRFRHRGPIDAAAGSEQLGGILGVPFDRRGRDDRRALRRRPAAPHFRRPGDRAARRAGRPRRRGHPQRRPLRPADQRQRQPAAVDGPARAAHRGDDRRRRPRWRWSPRSPG